MTVAIATSYLAETPSTWADPPPESTLTTILVFVGIPLLAMAAISLLVIAPSLARGPRYRPGQEWNAEAEWIGATPHTGSSASDRQLEGGASGTAKASDTAKRLGRGSGSGDSGSGDSGSGDSGSGDSGSGGASARW